MIKKKKSSHLKYWDLDKLYGWAMSYMLPADSFKWV